MNVSDYINRETALARLSYLETRDYTTAFYSSGIEDAMAEIKDIPAADVRENVHGEWISSGDEHQVCSVCGYCPEITIIEKLDENQKLISRIGCVKLTNFCPNCGVDMRGESDGL